MPDAKTESNVQSLVFTGFGSLPNAIMVRVTGISPTWLDTAISRLSFGRQRRDFAAQLLLTSVGLQRLGASYEQLEPLGREFGSGAASLPSRFRLGDGMPEEDDLEWTDRGHDAALLLYGPTTDETWQHFEDLFQSLTEVGRDDLRLPASGRELFGYKDGITNIALQGSSRSAADQVLDGEILLGHPDQVGRTLDPGPLGVDGSFVAVRQLRQDVRKFWSFWLQASNGDPERAILLASKSVGRWPNGMPIRPNQTTEPEFDDSALKIESFADDPLGKGCPFGSHVRRAHPRDTLIQSAQESTEISMLHRIMRRGRLFGPDAPASFYPAAIRDAMTVADESTADTPRGLMFIGLCSDLRRQFEFICQNWFNFPKHANLFNEVDPIMHREGMPDTFSIPTDDFNLYVQQVGQWVHPLASAYYLLPSQEVLRQLSS